MGEVTAISWCDHTFNPWIGCTKVSPACDGCYAEALMDKRYGRVEWGARGKGVGTRSRTSPSNWRQPLRWDRKAAKDGTRPFVFCSSLADVFDNQVPTAWRTDLFELIRTTPNLVWLLLTKRPQNIVRLFNAACDMAWPRNAAIGATVEDQSRANSNVPALLDAAEDLGALFSFLSCEPLLGEIVLPALPDWVITGGETDQGSHKARPSHPDWFRDLRDQCAAAGVAYHHKQNGEFCDFAHIGMAWNDLPDAIREKQRFVDGKAMIKVGKVRSGRLLDGVEHNARPRITSNG